MPGFDYYTPAPGSDDTDNQAAITATLPAFLLLLFFSGSHGVAISEARNPSGGGAGGVGGAGGSFSEFGGPTSSGNGSGPVVSTNPITIG